MRELCRVDRKLSEADALYVLGHAEYGMLNTINEDGWPYAVPMASALVENTLYFHSAKRGQKLENLRRCNRASYTAVLYAKNVPERFEMIYASAVAQGFVREITDEAERNKAMRAICEKYAAEYVDTPNYERTMKGMPALVMLAMDLEQVQGKANKGKLKQQEK